MYSNSNYSNIVTITTKSKVLMTPINTIILPSISAGQPDYYRRYPLVVNSIFKWGTELWTFLQGWRSFVDTESHGVFFKLSDSSIHNTIPKSALWYPDGGATVTRGIIGELGNGSIGMFISGNFASDIRYSIVMPDFTLPIYDLPIVSPQTSYGFNTGAFGLINNKPATLIWAKPRPVSSDPEAGVHYFQFAIGNISGITYSPLYRIPRSPEISNPAFAITDRTPHAAFIQRGNIIFVALQRDVSGDLTVRDSVLDFLLIDASTLEIINMTLAQPGAGVICWGGQTLAVAASNLDDKWLVVDYALAEGYSHLYPSNIILLTISANLNSVTTTIGPMATALEDPNFQINTIICNSAGLPIIVYTTSAAIVEIFTMPNFNRKYYKDNLLSFAGLRAFQQFDGRYYFTQTLADFSSVIEIFDNEI